MRKTKRLILAALLLGLLLAPLEMSGIMKRGIVQLGEVVSSKEAQVLVTKIKTGLPNLGARVSEIVSKLFPQLGGKSPFEIRIKEVR